jgi:hypothetical protein
MENFMGQKAMSNVINLKVGMKGFFRLLSYNPKTGVQTPVTEWEPNSMLLNGMNQMADFSDWAGGNSKCQVGTVSVPAPSTNDQQLLGYLAGTADTVEHTSGSQATPPYYGWDRTTYQFPSGPPIGEQNLQEAGVGWSTENAPPALITRALFTDGIGGNPTFTPLNDEVMQVQYELRYYPPLGDLAGTITLNSVVYNTITRAVNVTAMSDHIGRQMGQISVGDADWSAYDGLLGDIDDPTPNGVSAACDNSSQFNLAYVGLSYSIDMQCDCGPTGWNLGAPGIRTIRIRTTAGDFQTQFGEDPGALGNTIPKDINFTMSLVWRLGWSEATIP